MTDRQGSPSEASVRRNRYVPYVILGSLVLVIVLSTLLFRAAVLGHVDLPALLGTKNHGVLVKPPQRLSDLPIEFAGGDKFEFDKLQPQWTILIPAGRRCDEACAQTLYLTRQIHIALGKGTSRVRRYVLTNAYPLDAAFEQLLQKEHAKAQLLKADPAAFDGFFAKTGMPQPVQDNAYFIVDPEGWVMMYYTPQHSGKAVMADLKFLLSNSHEQEGGD